MTTVTTTSPLATSPSWDLEVLLTSGDMFFQSIIDGIAAAESSILFETYIFKDDALGQKLANALIEAARRGVKVRAMVDGIGSPGWSFTIGARLQEGGVEVNVYHQLPWERLLTPNRLQKVTSIISLWRAFNRRNHRKMCVVDNTTAWVGSMNVWSASAASLCGNQAWREMGIKIKGRSVQYLTAAFDLAWFPWFQRYKRFIRTTKRVALNSRGSFALLNVTKRLRWYQRKVLRTSIHNATKRIYIANAYFVPQPSILSALKIAAKRGVDVRIVTSIQSDIFFMPWIAATFQATLLKSGVAIHWYKPCFLHAKYIIIDDWVAVGSSNFNQRSFHHDLEVDIASTTSSTVQELTSQFEQDLSLSQLMQCQDFTNRPWWQKLFGRVVLLFKYFL